MEGSLVGRSTRLRNAFRGHLDRLNPWLCMMVLAEEWTPWRAIIWSISLRLDKYSRLDTPQQATGRTSALMKAC